MQFPYQFLCFGKYLFNIWGNLYRCLKYEKSYGVERITIHLFFSTKNNLVLHINLVFSVFEYVHGY